MHTTAAHRNNEIRPRTRYTRRRVLAAIAAAASLALVPASASAQTLNDVALNTSRNVVGLCGSVPQTGMRM